MFVEALHAAAGMCKNLDQQLQTLPKRQVTPAAYPICKCIYSQKYCMLQITNKADTLRLAGCQMWITSACWLQNLQLTHQSFEH